MFSKFSEFSSVTWGILAALIVLCAVLYVMSRDREKWTTRMLANAALCMALAFILSYVRLYKLPQGGSITPASMLPIFMFAYAYGIGPGMSMGFAYGLLQFIQEGYFEHPIELLLDYPLAFAMLGLAAVARNLPENWGLISGILLGTFGRFVCAFIAGVVFFGMYAPEGQNVFVYSAIYNGFYLIPEAIICIVIAAIPQVRKVAKQLALQA